MVIYLHLVTHNLHIRQIHLPHSAHRQAKHLGHTCNCCVNFSADLAYKKGQFIGCVNSIITQFGFAHPVCKLKLLVTHGCNFYGSSLCDLYDNDSKRLYITWNIAVRRLYDLHRRAHYWCTLCKS